MKKCCKNKKNWNTIIDSEVYNMYKQVIQKKIKCSICGKITRICCEDLDKDTWVDFDEI